MVTFDTNVWVRYLVNDDPSQARRALSLLEQVDAVFIPKTVVFELEWVLRAAYGLDREAVRRSLLQILGLAMVTVEAAPQVAAALDFHGRGFDFADAFHLASSDAVNGLYTFDQSLIRQGKDELPPVLEVPD